MFNLDDAGKKSREAMEGMLGSYSEMARGFQAIAAEASAYSQRSFEQMTAFMDSLVSSRSLNDTCQLQAAYVTSSCSSLMDEGSKLGNLYADLARSTCRHYERPAAATPTAVAATEAG